MVAALERPVTLHDGVKAVHILRSEPHRQAQRRQTAVSACNFDLVD
jgi:hypothetical protein